MTQVQKIFSQNPHQDENATNNGRGVNDPKMIGGIVGGLSVLGLLILGAQLLRRKIMDAKNNSEEQDTGTGDQRPDAKATELAPDTKKSELQCPSDPPVAINRGSVQSPRTGVEVGEGQTSCLSPVGANRNMITPVGELAAPNKFAGREAELSNIASKTHESGELRSIPDRITI